MGLGQRLQDLIVADSRIFLLRHHNYFTPFDIYKRSEIQPPTCLPKSLISSNSSKLLEERMLLVRFYPRPFLPSFGKYCCKNDSILCAISLFSRPDFSQNLARDLVFHSLTLLFNSRPHQEVQQEDCRWTATNQVQDQMPKICLHPGLEGCRQGRQAQAEFTTKYVNLACALKYDIPLSELWWRSFSLSLGHVKWAIGSSARAMGQSSARGTTHGRTICIAERRYPNLRDGYEPPQQYHLHSLSPSLRAQRAEATQFNVHFS